MTREWNNRNDGLNHNDGNGSGSFQEHNEHVREFRKSHANVAMVNEPRLGEAALIESMEPLQVSRNIIETGGSALPNDTTDKSPLVPMPKVAQYKLSRN